MELKELNAEQRIQLKQRILVDREEGTFYSELANADALVSNEELEDQFGGTCFVEDDFI